MIYIYPECKDTGIIESKCKECGETFETNYVDLFLEGYLLNPRYIDVYIKSDEVTVEVLPPPECDKCLSEKPITWPKSLKWASETLTEFMMINIPLEEITRQNTEIAKVYVDNLPERKYIYGIFPDEKQNKAFIHKDEIPFISSFLATEILAWEGLVINSANGILWEWNGEKWTEKGTS